MTKEKSSQNSKYLYLEILRIVACFFVIFNHTEGFSLYRQETPGSATFVIYSVLSLASKVAVPVFFGISGAVLLGKEEKITDIYKKRVSKTAIALVLFSLFYYLCAVKSQAEVFSVGLFFDRLFGEGWVLPFWFLYAYLAFLMLLPILRNLVKNMSPETVRYAFVLVVVFGVVKPLLEREPISLHLNGSWDLSMLTETIVLYPVMGYFLHNAEIKKKTVLVAVLNGGNLLLLVLSAFMATVSETGTELFTGFTLIQFLTLFITAKCIFETRAVRGWAEKFLISLGGCTFGIYLLHIFFVDKFALIKRLKGLYFSALSGVDTMILAIGYALFILLISYGCVWILKKIPGIRKIL